ncbi:MAG TPA: glycosyltransferase family 2 protein [Patescibacteria group bacterium]|nr:glycosyltransferase family 2 protein [Patescibacteria group bacterium]
MKLSIIVPVFNEEKTIVSVLEKLLELTFPTATQREIVIVDDGSKDKTVGKIKEFLEKHKKDGVFLFQHAKNAGKGQAIRTGVEKANGEYIIIQDADLEYNPKDIVRLFQEVLDKKAEVVYGTRLKRLPHFEKEERTGRFLLHYAGNKLLSLITSALYGQWITDMETCYKLFPKKAVVHMDLRAKGFEFEPEITAKLIKEGYKIHEIPIQTKPRGYTEGKKLNTFRDGKKALWTLLLYRFSK